jgi:lipoate-protein ligase A
MKGYTFKSSHTDPYRNLAFEEYLLGICERYGEPILYLWQNADTVVVGRNQNLFAECNMPFLREKGILAARRLTGGGAVYHDLGNINYTIITSSQQYSIDDNTQIIINALEKLGLDVFRDGRNDICTQKGKISGNAYYSNDRIGMQHGTILYRADTETMEKALCVPEGKLSKRGIKSVRSRVSDIYTQDSGITIADIKEALTGSFVRHFAITECKEEIPVEAADYSALIDKYSSPEWIEGKIRDYDHTERGYFSWGLLELSMLMTGERVSDIAVNTDCIDPEFVDCLQAAIQTSLVKQNAGYFPRIGEDGNLPMRYRDMISDTEDLLSRMLAENGIKYEKDN